jgi:hypothetical protein
MAVRTLELLVVLTTTLLLTACVPPVPVPLLPKDASYITENEVEELVSKSVSREYVVETLGMPLRYTRHEISYEYCRQKGGIYIPDMDGYFNRKLSCYELILKFDKQGVLRSYSKVPRRGQLDESAEDMHLRELGKQGDPIAQELWEKKSRVDFDYMRKQEDIEGDAKLMYRAYRGMSYEYIDPVSAWKWLCKAADMGYENAQLEVAYWHRENSWKIAKPHRREWIREAGIQADDRIAYLWYTLAAKGDDKRLQIRDYLFSEPFSGETLSGKEIAEAKDMVSNWKPGQCPTPYQ